MKTIMKAASRNTLGRRAGISTLLSLALVFALFAGLPGDANASQFIDDPVFTEPGDDIKLTLQIIDMVLAISRFDHGGDGSLDARISTLMTT